MNTTTHTRWTLSSVRTMTQNLWFLAQHLFDHLPDGDIPVFAINQPVDVRQRGIGFRLDELNAKSVNDAMDHVLRELSVVITFYRTQGQPSEAALIATWQRLSAALESYGAWEAARATKH